MKISVILAALLLGLSAYQGNAAQSSAVPSAYESVQSSTDHLLKKLLEVQHIYSADKARFFQEVDSSLAPFIDFKGFSRGVMAKYYRRASDQQKQRFAVVFRAALIKTYSRALVEFENQKIIVKQDNKPQKNPNKARVSLEVYGKDGTIYPIEYSMTLIDNQWKLRNIVINGINIGLQFRSQFTEYMQRHKNNIDKVIDNWTVDA